MNLLTATQWIRDHAWIGYLLGAVAFAYGVRMARHAAAAETRVKDAEASLHEHVAALRTQVALRDAAEAQVRQMQKVETIGQLTGGIAHDVNNMLAVVIGNLEMARRRAAEPERFLDSVASANEAAARASQLIARLLAFSRRQPPEPSALDVNAIVADMADLMRRTLGETIAVETRLTDGLWRCFADSIQLENALLNLAINARDAMPTGGVLTIETGNAERSADDGAPGRHVTIVVTDNGGGMPPSVRERAFEPFFTTKVAGRGTGLGLAQVDGFVRQAGGSIEIESEVGVGTIVRLLLPRHCGAETAAADRRDEAPLPPARPGEVVLVVEDEAAVRSMSVDVLRELGYRVLSAADAHEALAILAAEPRVDGLFTDAMMPGMGGLHLAEVARVACPGLAVLVTTAHPRDVVARSGAPDDMPLLAKPFTLAALARALREGLDRRVDPPSRHA